jgi:carbonic anhydrase
MQGFHHLFFAMPQALKSLLDNNRQWAQTKVRDKPDFFTGLLKQQTPQYLWIGCADSRVPANELVDLAPGELFVHRNIANVVAHSDLNGLSVIQFATDALKVKHIMVVGHSNCGGVRAALEDQRVGLADNWIRHVKDVRSLHQAWLETLPATDRLNALCELNVVEQALNVCQSPSTQDAWIRGQLLSVHGWVYGLQNGLLQDLTMSVSSLDEVQSTYVQALAHVRARHTTEAAS